MSLKNRLFQRYKDVAEYFTPVQKKSEFAEKGVLTPEEFVAAGDVLVQMTPAWTWMSADTSKRVPHLPKEKQYLLIKNVICSKRVAALWADTKEEDVAGEDGWVGTTVGTGSGETAVEMDCGDAVCPPVAGGATSASSSSSSSAAQPPACPEGEGEEDIPDLEEFADDNVVQDVAAVAPPSCGGEQGKEGIVVPRTYNISITYDNYYHTPRVWLCGYSEAGRPLTKEETFQDIDSEFSNKTATFETHPFSDVPHVAIHPCRHAEQMVRMTERLNAKAHEVMALKAQNEGESFDPAEAPMMRPDLYLIVFLKMIQVMIPTIEYDIAFMDI
eukprot:RCo046362